MKKHIIAVIFLLLQFTSRSQNVCDVLKNILIDGKNKYEKFYGENKGAVGGFAFNDIRSVRKDMLNGTLFVAGTISRLRLKDLYEDATMKGEVWSMSLSGPPINYSAIAEQERLGPLKQGLAEFVEPIATNCFSELNMSQVKKTPDSSYDENASDNEICYAYIYMNEATIDGVLNESLLPLTPHIKFSIRQSTADKSRYFIQYFFSYPVDEE